MSTHSMITECNDCQEEFYIDMEYETPAGLIYLAETTVCPKCKSANWTMTDGCER